MKATLLSFPIPLLLGVALVVFGLAFGQRDLGGAQVAFQPRQHGPLKPDIEQRRALKFLLH